MNIMRVLAEVPGAAREKKNLKKNSKFFCL